MDVFPYQPLNNSYNSIKFTKKNLYDPSIGQESITTIDVLGVLLGHILFGVSATLLFDWSWIPLSPLEKDSGRSLKEIKKSWGWDNKPDHKDDYLRTENKES